MAGQRPTVLSAHPYGGIGLCPFANPFFLIFNIASVATGWVPSAWWGLCAGIRGQQPGGLDGDGVADPEDAFPVDPEESVDTDGDVGNNADPDDDGDGYEDDDAFPLTQTNGLIPMAMGWVTMPILKTRLYRPISVICCC